MTDPASPPGLVHHHPNSLRTVDELPVMITWPRPLPFYAQTSKTMQVVVP